MTANHQTDNRIMSATNYYLLIVSNLNATLTDRKICAPHSPTNLTPNAQPRPSLVHQRGQGAAEDTLTQ